MEFFAVLDVLIYIFHDIFGERRSEEATMAEGAMTKLRAALAPGDDFAAVEMFADFFLKLIVAGHIAIDDLAVVEDGFDLLRSRIGAKRKGCKRGAARMASEFLAREKAGAEGRACVTGNWLDVNILKAAAEFKGADDQNI